MCECTEFARILDDMTFLKFESRHDRRFYGQGALLGGFTSTDFEIHELHFIFQAEINLEKVNLSRNAGVSS
jgi:hypothetical protein